MRIMAPSKEPQAQADGTLSQLRAASPLTCHRNAGERDDLKALLVATLKRLETVDDVVRRADMANAVAEERCGVLEGERDRARADLAAAQARVAELTKAQRRVEWQNKVCVLIV